MVNNIMFECVAGRRITRNKEEMPASAMLEYMVEYKHGGRTKDKRTALTAGERERER